MSLSASSPSPSVILPFRSRIVTSLTTRSSICIAALLQMSCAVVRRCRPPPTPWTAGPPASVHRPKRLLQAVSLFCKKRPASVLRLFKHCQEIESSKRPSFRSASVVLFARPPENRATPSRIIPSRPTKRTPWPVRALRSRSSLLGAADELRRGHGPGANEVVDLVVALVRDPRRRHPPHDVPPAVAAGHANVLADGQRHRPPGTVQLLGDLDAARRGTDDEHAALGQIGRSAVDVRRDRHDPVRRPPPPASGTCGTVQPPFASMTVGASQSPWSVITR